MGDAKHIMFKSAGINERGFERASLKFDFRPDAADDQDDKDENDAHHISGADAGATFGMSVKAAVEDKVAANDANNPDAQEHPIFDHAGNVI